MRTALVVLIASLAMVLAGCGSTIKPKETAQFVTDNVAEQTGFKPDLFGCAETGFKPNDMKCPSGVDAEVGKEFECHFTGPDGKKYTAHMKVTKVEGTVVGFNIQIRPS